MKKQINKPAPIGVWLDHTEARLIEPEKSVSDIKIILSEFQGRERIPGETATGTKLGKNRSTNNESHKNNFAQNEKLHFYKNIAENLRPYNNILLFGPTKAKEELKNFLVSDKKFAGKSISTEAADKMSDNQLAAQVKKYFSAQTK